MKKVYKTLGVLLAIAFCTACNDSLETEPDFLDQAPDGSRLEEDNNPYWDWVGTFPGWIDAKVERVDFTPVVIDGCYIKVPRESRIGFAETPWVSTGYYAAPGEWITLVKPSRLKTAVSWRIGEWKCELEGVATLQRYGKVFETGAFTSDTMRVRSWFGGHIYILPEQPFARPETFILKGGIKSPDFIAGTTDAASWMQEIKKAVVPYAELVGKYTIWTLPLETLQKITDPEGLLALYDDFMVNDFWALHGLSPMGTGVNKAPDFPVRVVQDIQLCNGKASHAGYPIVIDKSEAELGTDVDGMRSSSVAWNFFRELGHNYQTWCWSWGAVKEVVNMLPYYHARARVLGQWPTVRSEKDEPDRGVLKWKEYILREYVGVKDPAKDFDESSSDLGQVISSQNGRMMPFIQLAQKYGWGLYAYLGKYSRNMLGSEDAKVIKILTTNGRRDFFCKRVCEYAGVNLAPFFDAWGIKYSPAAAEDMKQYPDYEGEKFWEKWESAHMPEENSGDITPDIQLADNNYNEVYSLMDETLWKIDSVSGEEGTSVIGNLIDGTTKYWGTEKVKRTDFTGSEPWFALDMKSVRTVSVINVRHRNSLSTWRWHPQVFKVEYKYQPEDEWTEAGTVTAEKEEKLIGKMIPLDITPFTGRYLRVTLMKAYEDNKGNAEGGLYLDEFTVTGKPFFEGGIVDVEEEFDFPEWK